MKVVDSDSGLTLYPMKDVGCVFVEGEHIFRVIPTSDDKIIIQIEIDTIRIWSIVISLRA